MKTVVVIVVIVIVVVLVILLVLRVIARRRRTSRLQETFGPEYDRTVEATGDRRQAENELAQRQERVAELNIHSLSDDQRQEFSNTWQSIQSEFVDDPAGAVTHADRLVAQVMEARGYPVGNFEQRAADVSVDHPTVVEHYRAAHEVALRQVQGEADTEDLRNGLVHYRALFEELLEWPAGQPTETG